MSRRQIMRFVVPVLIGSIRAKWNVRRMGVPGSHNGGIFRLFNFPCTMTGSTKLCNDLIFLLFEWLELYFLFGALLWAYC